jgi:DNA mismatch endonuclease, patch repair protein
MKRGIATDPVTSARMRRIRQRSTKPEVMLRRWLWLRGVRYRCCVRGLPGSPDLVNVARRWAIFVHGCFWHGHDGCVKATIPKRNAEFWISKIADNRRRDAHKVRALRKLGFDVVTIWQCEIELRRTGAAHCAPGSSSSSVVGRLVGSGGASAQVNVGLLRES